MNKEQTIEERQLELLEQRLPDADEETLQMLLEDVKFIALDNLYPYEEILPEELPYKYLNWQLRVAEYMYKHKDTFNFKSYAENELSIEFFSDAIPKSFMHELVPYAGAIRKKRPFPHCHHHKHIEEDNNNGI